MSFPKAVFCAALFALAGCVSTSTLEKQVLETRSLQESLQSRDATISQLRTEKEAASRQLAVMATELQTLTQTKDRVSAERDQLRQERERLVSDNLVLEKALQARTDTFSKNIDNLRQKSGETEQEAIRLRGLLASRDDEISRLKEDLADLRKVREQGMRGASKLLEDLLEKLKGEISRGEAAVSELQGSVTITVAAAALFDPGKADLKGAGVPLLKKIAEVGGGKEDWAVRIESHTDAHSFEGSTAQRFPSSWELSALRAAGVTRALQQQGLDAALLSAAAFGQYRPLPGEGDDGRGRNNRIDIIFVPR